MGAFAHYGTSAERISDLRDLAAVTLTRGSSGLLAYLSPALGADLAVALADPGKVDAGLAEKLAAAVADLNSRIGTVPFARLQVGLAPMAEACRGLLAAAVTAEVERRFLLATAACTLAARLAFESHDDASSADYYAEALDAAGRLPDYAHRAVVRTSQAMVTLYATGDLARATAIGDQAVRDARRGSSPRIRTRALAGPSPHCTTRGTRWTTPQIPLQERSTRAGCRASRASAGCTPETREGPSRNSPPQLDH